MEFKKRSRVMRHELIVPFKCWNRNNGVPGGKRIFNGKAGLARDEGLDLEIGSDPSERNPDRQHTTRN
jgi:hypothetical protein